MHTFKKSQSQRYVQPTSDTLLQIRFNSIVIHSSIKQDRPTKSLSIHCSPQSEIKSP